MKKLTIQEKARRFARKQEQLAKQYKSLKCRAKHLAEYANKLEKM